MITPTKLISTFINPHSNLSCGVRFTSSANFSYTVHEYFSLLHLDSPMKYFCVKKYANLSSVQFSHSVMSDSLRPQGLQHARPPCPSPTPAVYSNSCPLSRWCHLTISSSVIPLSFCPQSFPALGSFPVLCIRWPKYWSFSFSISPSNEYSGLISFRMD